MDEIYGELPNSLNPMKADKLYFCIIENETEVIMHSIEDNSFVVDRVTEHDIEGFGYCRTPHITYRNDTITTQCEITGILYGDYFLFTESEFKYVGSYSDDSNEETQSELDEAEDALSYCSACTGLQYVGRDGVSRCVSDGLYMLRNEVDNLLKAGRCGQLGEGL